MKVGVIIPVYNRETFIASALRSVIRQSDAAELNIVVVDDGSTDGTAKIVNDLARHEQSIRVVVQENQGVTRARNTGLANLDEDVDLVTFLDSDDIMPAGRIAAELKHFEKVPELDLTYGRMTLVDGIDDENLMAMENCQAVTVRGISLAAGLYRPEWFERLDGFDEQFGMAEDADFLFRLFEKSPRYILTDSVAVIYRRHLENMTREKESVRRYIMLALLNSVKRRRRDPSLVSLEGIFDVNDLLGVRWV